MDIKNIFMLEMSQNYNDINKLQKKMSQLLVMALTGKLIKQDFEINNFIANKFYITEGEFILHNFGDIILIKSNNKHNKLLNKLNLLCKKIYNNQNTIDKNYNDFIDLIENIKTNYDITKDYVKNKYEIQRKILLLIIIGLITKQILQNKEIPILTQLIFLPIITIILTKLIDDIYEYLFSSFCLVINEKNITKEVGRSSNLSIKKDDDELKVIFQS